MVHVEHPACAGSDYRVSLHSEYRNDSQRPFKLFKQGAERVLVVGACLDNEIGQHGQVSLGLSLHGDQHRDLLQAQIVIDVRAFHAVHLGCHFNLDAFPHSASVSVVVPW